MEDQSGVLIQDQPHQQLILVHSSSHHHQQCASNTEFHSPCLFPLHRDVGQLVFPQWTDRGRKNPESGRPTQCIKKTSHNFCRGSLSVFPCILPHWPPNANVSKRVRRLRLRRRGNDITTWQWRRGAEQRKMNSPTMTTRPQQQGWMAKRWDTAPRPRRKIQHQSRAAHNDVGSLTPRYGPTPTKGDEHQGRAARSDAGSPTLRCETPHW